jgi:hypothetical protein
MDVEEFGPGDGTYTSIVGMDPLAEWLLGPGIQDYLPDGEETLFACTIKINDPDRMEVFNRILEPGDGTGPPFLIPSFYYDPHNELIIVAGQYFTAFTRKSFFDELASSDKDTLAAFRGLEKEIRLGPPISRAAWPPWEPGSKLPEVVDPVVGPPPGGWPEGTVVVGIIDDGIAFANERFRTVNHGSRVQCFWRQDGPFQPSSTVTYGREICKAPDSAGRPGIDALVAQCTVAGVLNEDKLYRRAELINFGAPGHKSAAWRVAHGTHALDLAAGEGMVKDVLNRPIICVQLPTAFTEDSSLQLPMHRERLHDAIAYILNRAAALSSGGNPLPVVINFSYGNTAGPHDGTGPLEREMEDFLQQPGGPLRIILPAGNSHLSRCHAEVSFDGGGGQIVALEWRVQPDDRTPSFVQVWLPDTPALPAGAHRVRLSIVTPGGLETPLVGETHNTGVHVVNDVGEIICEARYAFEPAPTQRGLFRITLQPTARLKPAPAPDTFRIAPPGVWTIKLHNALLGVGDLVHAYIQRDDPPMGYPNLGRQSYFDHLCYVRFDAQGKEIEVDSHPEQVASPCHVKRAGLINAIATGDGPFVAGGYLRKDLRFAKYTAGGTDDAAFPRPDAALVTDDSKVHAGVLAAGSRSGSRVAINGTSVAAPQLARWVADELAAGNAGDQAALCLKAQADELALPGWKPLFEPARGGCGRMLRNSAFPRVRYWT